VTRLITRALGPISAAVVLAGCGGGSSGGAAPATPTPTATQPTSLPPSSPSSAGHRLRPGFHASNFGANTATGADQWLPLIPGRQTVHNGTVNVGHRQLTHRRVYTVTDAFKTIAGVRTVLVIDQDFNGGQLSEQSLDYLAEDRAGNVWYLGSYTETYESGQFVNATDGWLAGINGAAGTLMRAKSIVGSTYSQATAPGGPADATVVRVGQSKCVPYRCFNNVLVIEEGKSTSQPEFKYYAPGVGAILTEPGYTGGEHEVEKLVNVTTLSPKGLAAISAEAIKVDTHARTVFPKVFGHAAAATRGK
jgi:hypothetical protein